LRASAEEIIQELFWVFCLLALSDLRRLIILATSSVDADFAAVNSHF